MEKRREQKVTPGGTSSYSSGRSASKYKHKVVCHFLITTFFEVFRMAAYTTDFGYSFQ